MRSSTWTGARATLALSTLFREVYWSQCGSDCNCYRGLQINPDLQLAPLATCPDKVFGIRLERNIFVRNRRTSRWRVLRFRSVLIKVFVIAACRCRGSAGTAAIFASAFAASTKQYQIAGHNFGHVLFLSRCLIVPGAGLQATFDVNFAAFFQVLAGDLRQTLPEDDIVPLRPVLPLAVFTLEALIGREHNLRNWSALRCEFYFGVLAKISNEDDFIDAFAGHDCGLLRNSFMQDAHYSRIRRADACCPYQQFVMNRWHRSTKPTACLLPFG